MQKKVILTLLSGDFESGFSAILRIQEKSQPHQERQYEGKLPPNNELPRLFNDWQKAFKNTINPTSRDLTRIQLIEEQKLSCHQSANQLEKYLKDWLNSGDSWQKIRDGLLQNLDRNEEIKFIIQTDNDLLPRLPWHLWEVFNQFYKKAEVAISLPNYEPIEIIKYFRKKVRVLAILGNSEGIDIETDRLFLETLLQEAEIQFLVEPSYQQFSNKLWDEQGWDILFFAGHSATHEGEGIIYLNSQDDFKINNLEYALNHAIEKGLYLAIFNSCDGLGIAKALTRLNIPQIIIMREPVIDLVAQEFLKNFLQAFVLGKSLQLSVREAREKLQSLEKEFPCATWLPILYQNPTTVSINWLDLKQRFDTAIQEYPTHNQIKINQYIEKMANKLKNEGCLDLRTTEKYNDTKFNLVAKFSDFELEISILYKMRGDAFFIFYAFPTITIQSLKQFCSQCLEYAKQKATASFFERLVNVRDPMNFCFCIAIVNDLDETTKNTIRTKNPFDEKVNNLWYEVPIVYHLTEKKLYFFDRPSFWDDFKGEIVWTRLREIIHRILKIDN